MSIYFNWIKTNHFNFSPYFLFPRITPLLVLLHRKRLDSYSKRNLWSQALRVPPTTLADLSWDVVVVGCELAGQQWQLFRWRRHKERPTIKILEAEERQTWISWRDVCYGGEGGVWEKWKEEDGLRYQFFKKEPKRVEYYDCHDTTQTKKQEKNQNKQNVLFQSICSRSMRVRVVLVVLCIAQMDDRLVVLCIAQMDDRVPCGGGCDANGLGYVDKADSGEDSSWLLNFCWHSGVDLGP